MVHKVEFNNARGEVLRGVIHVPTKFDTAVIFLHGFPSRSVGFTGSRVTKEISKTSYLFLSFDFSGTDQSDGKFEDKLISKELQDIKAAVDYLSKNFSFSQLVLVGHSTGAINASLYSYKDSRVSKLVLIGGSGDLKNGIRYEFTPEQVRDFWMKGYMTYKNKEKWYHGFRLKKAYYDEFFSLDVLGSLHKFTGPVLIVHGGKDEIIPAEKDPRDLFDAATRPKKLVIVRNADHRFSQNTHFMKLLNHVNKFIKKKF